MSSPVSIARDNNGERSPSLQNSLSKELDGSNNDLPLYTTTAAHLKELNKILQDENAYLKQLVNKHVQLNFNLNNKNTILNTQLNNKNYLILLGLGICFGFVVGTLSTRFFEDLTKQILSPYPIL